MGRETLIQGMAAGIISLGIAFLIIIAVLLKRWIDEDRY
jgi:hypothetical protein